MVKAVTNYGEIKGRMIEDYLVFRGIPYAKPPVGELRFRPPQKPESWEGVRDCTEFGAPALQMFSINHVRQPYLLDISSEDCLYLNVSTPAVIRKGDGTGEESDIIMPDENAKLPVYIFIHGGAYETGGSNMALYHGENFIKNGIVYVNINYRMGSLGFLALEEFRRESSVTGCFGIQDTLSAVKWVKENIAFFGGDPDNITIGGESAGAFSVSILMGLPEAEGLFKRCILESGSVVTIGAIGRYGAGNPEVCRRRSLETVADLGADDSPEGVALLRSLPAEDIIRSWFFDKNNELRDIRTDPVLDGFLFEGDQIPDPYVQHMNDVDLLFGFNTDEGTLFIDRHAEEKDYEDHMRMVFDDLADMVLEKYPVDDGHTPFMRGAEVISLGAFQGCMLPYADRLSDMGNRVYGYHFDYMTEKLRKEGLGCRHIAELNFVFHKNLGVVGAEDEKGHEIASFMNQAWCNFIKTGDPGKGWPRYDRDSEMMMRIDSEPHPAPLSRSDEMRWFVDLHLGRVAAPSSEEI